MIGTSSTVGPTTTDVLPIDFSGYVDVATGYVINGTIDASVVITSGVISGTITGKLTSSGGPVTTQTWNVIVSGSSSNPTYSGIVSFNSDSFDAGTLSLNSVTQATQAAIASQRITQVMQNKTSWTGTSSVSYTLSPSVGMTGTFTTAGSTDTYSLTITYSNDSDSLYTVSGSLNLLLTVNNVSHAILSGTVTGNLTLSGGNVTTETWNISNISGSTNPGAGSYMASYAGTVTCNGTPFDAKTLYLQ
jgi:hypothetical protein